jgi:hypothetical protein
MEPILLGAAIGGGSAAVRGDDPLKGAVLGGLTGGIGNAAFQALPSMLPSLFGTAAPAAAPAAAAAAAPSAAPSLFGEAASRGIMSGFPQSFMPAMETATAMPINMGAVSSVPLDGAFDIAMRGAADAAGSAPMASLAEAAASPMAPPPLSMTASSSPITAAPASMASDTSALYKDPSSLFQAPARTASAGPEFGKVFSGTGTDKQGIKEWWSALSPEKKLLYGGAGGLGLMALMGAQRDVPGQAPYSGPLSRFRFNPDTYRPALAGGGLTDIYVGDPASAQPMARGGIADLGSYSDGGRLLKGPGDGMSDNIPATISNKRPARLADGEFVVPADVVSHLGNGSTDAGAKQLYKMMDRVRSARTGRKAQGKQIRAPKFMPA